MWSTLAKTGLVGLIVFVISNTVMIHYVADSLVQPERRSLQAYHQQWLTQPQQHGIAIQKHFSSDKQIPYLLVKPNPKHLGKRGKAIQQQLQGKGVSNDRLQLENGMVVLLHGRQGRKEDLLPIAERFAAAGFYAVLPDLPAHGDSPITTVHFATTDFEKNIANHVLADARRQLKKPSLPAYIWGMSMGGVFANAAVVTQPENWQAMVIVASFDSLENTLKNRIAFLPDTIQATYVRKLQHTIERDYHFSLVEANSESWATQITIPVLVVHGDADSVIAMSQGKRLYNAYGSEYKQWIRVPNANHHNVLVTRMPVYAEMVSWFLQHSTK